MATSASTAVEAGPGEAAPSSVGIAAAHAARPAICSRNTVFAEAGGSAPAES